VEGEGTTEGEAEQAAEGEGEANTEQQAEGEGPLPGEGRVEGELAEGQVPGEGEAPVGPEGEGPVGPEGEQQLAGRPGPVEGGPGEPGEGDQIEQVAFAAADEAVQAALAQGAGANEAQQIGQQAALSAAVAEARSQGITEAEIAAATAAFDAALADGASLEDAFFAAGNAAEVAGDAAAVQFDQHQAELRQAAANQDFGAQPEGGDVQQDQNPDGEKNDGGDGGQTGHNEFHGFDTFGHLPGGDPFTVDFNYGSDFDLYNQENFQIYSGLNGDFQEFEQPQQDDGPPPVIQEFGEFISDFTLGDDVRIGNNVDTRFEMTVFGGNDTVFGNGGTDEIAFINLENAYGVYDATGTSPQITFQDGDANISGSVTLDSVEQIFASIPGGDRFRVNATDENGNPETGYGIVYAGDTGNDTIDLSSGSLSFTNHSSENFDISTNMANILGTIIFGADGNDTLTGVSGQENQVYGGTGDDSLTGGSDTDTLDGGTGNDTLTGAAGNDHLLGKEGNDTLDGGAGNDSLTGGDGDDFMTGAGGNDVLIAGSGADTLAGGAGNDALNGGAGADRFVFTGTGASGLGTDVLSDFSGATAFGGGSGDGDDIVLDTSDLNINSIAYEEYAWDGTSGTINLTNSSANVIVMTGSAGSQSDLLTALAAGTNTGDGTSGKAVILFHDSGAGDRLTMLHTDDIESASANVHNLAGFSGVTDTDAAAALDSGDFALQT